MQIYHIIIQLHTNKNYDNTCDYFNRDNRHQVSPLCNPSKVKLKLSCQCPLKYAMAQEQL